MEAQNQFYPGYPLIKRGIYYCCRMVSSQYGTVFTSSHYEKIKKVYSIWICTNPPEYRKIGEEVSQMCNLSEGVEQKGIQKGILESIGNLMDTMNWTAKEAMDALKIKAEERSLYEKLLI